MPTVHITQTVALADGRHYTAGSMVDLTPEQVQEATVGGWGELPGSVEVQTPEKLHEKRSRRPERRG